MKLFFEKLCKNAPNFVHFAQKVQSQPIVKNLHTTELKLQKPRQNVLTTNAN